MRAVSVIAACVVVACAAAAVWWLTRSAPLAPTNVTDATTPDSSPPTLPVAPSAARVDPSAARTDLSATATPTVTDATVHGRCIDDNRAPRPAVRVTTNRHGVAAQTTGADGTFTFRVPPTTDRALGLHFHAADCVTMRLTCPDLAAGAIVDLGDIVLTGGVRVIGRIVDADGRPVANRAVTLRTTEPEPEPGVAATSQSVSAGTDADGRFAFATPLRAGTWLLSNRSMNVLQPGPRVVLAGKEHVLDIVVATPPPTTTIEGRVVDDVGAAVPFAWVDVVDHDGRTQGSRSVTRDDGRFALRFETTAVPPEPFALRVLTANHEPLVTERLHRTGTKDVTLVVSRGREVELHVRRADDGTPVEHFTVDWSAHPDDRSPRVKGAWEHGDGPHRNGIARLPRLPRGRYLLSITPTPATGLCAASFVDLPVDDRSPSIVPILLSPPSTRRVVVADPHDRPIAGATVELVVATPRARVVDTATTDTAGTCQLRGSPTSMHTVRVGSAGSLPVVVENVSLSDPQPLRVVAMIGATLRGRLVPLAVVDELTSKRPGGMRASPTLTLRGSGVGEVPLAADGSFVIAAVPTGSFDLRLRLGRLGISGSEVTLRAGMSLVAGETTDVEIDVSAHRPARLLGTVWLDGKPHDGFVRIGNGAEMQTVLADGAGRFDVALPPGTWRVGAARGQSNENTIAFAAPEVAQLDAGQTREFAFHARSAQQKVRVLAADGTPAVGVTLLGPSGALGSVVRAAPTDAEGRTELLGSPGTHELRARVGPLHARTSKLGPLTLPSSDDVVELRLPPDRDR